MSSDKPITVLCVSSYEKGHDFMRECKEQGCRVLLLTSKSLEGAPWPKESIDEILSAMEMIVPIKYDIKDNEVTIFPK